MPEPPPVIKMVLSVIFMSTGTLTTDYSDENGSKEVLFWRQQYTHPEQGRGSLTLRNRWRESGALQFLDSWFLDSNFRCHHGMTLRSRQNLPVSVCGASVASQTIPEAPSATERVAFDPPMSVRTQPGQTELMANFGKAAASWEVTPFNAVLEMQ